MSEIILDTNDPYLTSEEGKKRKMEINMFFFCNSEKLRNHMENCPIARFGHFEDNCEICKKFIFVSNFLAQEEHKRKGEILDLPEILKKGIIDCMVFGDGFLEIYK